jgi:hypothetical protein
VALGDPPYRRIRLFIITWRQYMMCTMGQSI